MVKVEEAKGAAAVAREVVATAAGAVAVRVGATAREAVGMVAAAEVPVEARVAVATPDRAA
jgi:hypothetical protein